MKSLCVLFSFFLCSQLAFAASPKSDYFTTSDGVKIHFLEAGEGRAIVFVPGWTMPADIWQQQIDYFASKYHVIAVDPRSQGDSDKAADGNYTERRAQDYKELVDHLKLDRPMLVGWSLAVSELLSYAEQFGADKIAGLVLVDGFIKLDPAMLSSFPVWLKGFQVNRKKMTGDFVRSMYKKPQSEDYLAKITADSLKTPTNSAMALMLATLGRPDYSDALGKLGNTPVIFEFEPQLQSQADVLKAKVPTAKLDLYSDDGHALFVDDAKRFNRDVEELMTQTAGK